MVKQCDDCGRAEIVVTLQDVVEIEKSSEGGEINDGHMLEYHYSNFDSSHNSFILKNLRTVSAANFLSPRPCHHTSWGSCRAAIVDDGSIGEAAGEEMVSGDAAKEYVAGFAAGIAMVITGHPFDTVKVKLQAHNTKTQVKEYRNALHCTTRIISTEGVKGLYKGATSSFIGIALESSLFFGIYSQTKQLLQGESQSSKPQLQVIIPSGAFVGALISLVLSPAELIKCRMQVQGKDSALSSYVRYNGPLDCALKTIKNEGIKGMFRGGLTTVLRESIGNAVFFTTYESSRYYMHSNLNHPQGQASKLLQDAGIGIITGGISGMAFWATVLPLDVAKTVIQTTPDAKSSRNPMLTLYSIYRRFGLRGCYAGFGPTLARAFPANAAAIVTLELTAQMLGVKRD